MGTSTPLMVREECWLTPFSRDKGSEETCTLMRMKGGRMGDEVGFLHFGRKPGKPFVTGTLNPEKVNHHCNTEAFPMNSLVFELPIQVISSIQKKDLLFKIHQLQPFLHDGPTLCGCDITVLYSRLQPVGCGRS